MAIATLMKDFPVGECLNSVKIKCDFKQNIKNLGNVSKENLVGKVKN